MANELFDWHKICHKNVLILIQNKRWIARKHSIQIQINSNSNDSETNNTVVNVNSTYYTQRNALLIQVFSCPFLDLCDTKCAWDLKLDTGTMVFLITEASSKSAGILILSESHHAIKSNKQSYLLAIKGIDMNLYWQVLIQLLSTGVVLSKLYCEILRWAPFIMTDQIVININLNLNLSIVVLFLQS